MSDSFTPAEYVISKLGGVNATARLIEKNPSVVSGWKERGFIPSNMQSLVLVRAIKAGFALSPTDFFEKGVRQILKSSRSFKAGS